MGRGSLSTPRTPTTVATTTTSSSSGLSRPQSGVPSCYNPILGSNCTPLLLVVFFLILIGHTYSYRVCQGSWPSLIVVDEDIEPQNFWASSKSHVATSYLSMQFCSNYIGLSNQDQYYEIEVQFAEQDVATWLFDEANIFQFDIFVRKQRPIG